MRVAKPSEPGSMRLAIGRDRFPQSDPLRHRTRHSESLETRPGEIPRILVLALEKLVIWPCVACAQQQLVRQIAQGHIDVGRRLLASMSSHTGSIRKNPAMATT